MRLHACSDTAPVHPYRTAPDRAFWRRSVSTGFSGADLLDVSQPLVRRGERVVTAGSCFATNIVPYLERSGLSHLRVETRHPALGNQAREGFGYENFSAAYGNIYTARSLLQLLRRSLGRFRPVEDRWISESRVVDPFRPGLKYPAVSEREFDLLDAQYLRSVRRAFEQGDVFIFTLGLTEAWVSVIDGAVFPACPGTVAGRFDPKAHAFVNFTSLQVTADLADFVTELRAVNAGVRVILTVSPVPLVATGGDRHVLCASTYSKSVLRVAAEETARAHSCVTYFPAYEIVSGPQAPAGFLGADHRSVSPAAIDAVMSAFLAHCETGAPAAAVAGAPPSKAAKLASSLSDIECEEAMMDRPEQRA